MRREWTGMLLAVFLVSVGCTRPETTRNELGMTFVRIEPGTFSMGNEKGEAVEKPAHEVSLTRPFEMQTTEVTVAQFRMFVEETGYSTTAEREGGTFVYVNGGWGPRDDASWRNPYHPTADDYPVTCVSWHDAVEFARWLSSKTGDTYRLPTEAEWEYACRAGSTTELPWGDDVDGDYCWYRGNSGETPRPVGERKPNAWGLHDMIGNAAEWCSDWYSEVYYVTSPSTDPAGPDSGVGRVARGGSWLSDAENCRSSLRLAARPELASPMGGFRLVRTARDDA